MNSAVICSVDLVSQNMCPRQPTRAHKELRAYHPADATSCPIVISERCEAAGGGRRGRHSEWELGALQDVGGDTRSKRVRITAVEKSKDSRHRFARWISAVSSVTYNRVCAWCSV